MYRIISFEVYGITPFYVPFRIEMTKRIAAIVGKNGAGKSMLLRCLEICFSIDDGETGLSTDAVCNDKPYLSFEIVISGITYQIKKELKCVRTKVNISTMDISPAPSEDVILQLEKLRAIRVTSDRFCDTKCSEILSITDQLNQSLIDYLEKYTVEIENGIRELTRKTNCSGPFSFVPSLDWKKAIRLETQFHLQRPLCDDDTDFDFSNVNAGNKKKIVSQIAFDRAELSENTVILLDDIEAFFDRSSLNCTIERIQRSPFFVAFSTNSNTVLSLLGEDCQVCVVDPYFDSAHVQSQSTSEYVIDFLL